MLHNVLIFFSGVMLGVVLGLLFLALVTANRFDEGGHP